MDGDGKKPRGVPKAARPAPADDDTQQQPAVGAALETPVLSDDATATAAQQVDDGKPVASVDESHGAEEDDNGGDDNDDDDEQVERFYALLANIRAMRGLPLRKHSMAAASSFCAALGGDTDTAADSTRTKKRLRRSAEPPWRPVFRMEDFEQPAPAPAASTSCKMRKRARGAGHEDDGESSGGSALPTVAVVPSSSSTMPHAAVRFQQSDSSS